MEERSRRILANQTIDPRTHRGETADTIYASAADLSTRDETCVASESFPDARSTTTLYPRPLSPTQRRKFNISSDVDAYDITDLLRASIDAYIIETLSREGPTKRQSELKSSNADARC